MPSKINNQYWHISSAWFWKLRLSIITSNQVASRKETPSSFRMLSSFLLIMVHEHTPLTWPVHTLLSPRSCCTSQNLQSFGCCWHQCLRELPSWSSWWVPEPGQELIYNGWFEGWPTLHSFVIANKLWHNDRGCIFIKLRRNCRCRAPVFMKGNLYILTFPYIACMEKN